MSGSVFAQLPKGTQIRQAAVAVIKSQGTQAGLNIWDSPLDPVPNNAAPRINVFSEERRDGIGMAGGRPYLQARYTLMIQCLGIAALPADAVFNADVLKQQVLDALLEDPRWPGMVEAITSIEEKRDIGQDGERYIVNHQVNMLMGWKEDYPARTGSVLNGNGFPGRPAPVIAPLKQVNNTIVAGEAPGAERHGEVPTEFTMQTPLPPP